MIVRTMPANAKHHDLETQPSPAASRRDAAAPVTPAARAAIAPDTPPHIAAPMPLEADAIDELDADTADDESPITVPTAAPATNVPPTDSSAPSRPGKPRKRKRSFLERIDAFISRLSTRNNFWHRVCSMIWLPYAFRSGIQMKRVDATTFTAILPFRRFNRNWYNAMAGAALLGNAEIAGGMYVFGVAGGEYTVVCKNLNYTFLRPCLGPAMYRIKPQEDLNALVAAGHEFNITLDMDVVQQIGIPGKRDKRVGRTVVTFHVTPKSHHKTKRQRQRSTTPS